MGPGQKLVQVYLGTTADAHLEFHYVPPISQGADYYAVGQQTRIYADPATGLQVCAARDTTVGGDTGFLFLTISGYTVVP